MTNSLALFIKINGLILCCLGLGNLASAQYGCPQEMRTARHNTRSGEKIDLDGNRLAVYEWDTLQTRERIQIYEREDGDWTPLGLPIMLQGYSRGTQDWFSLSGDRLALVQRQGYLGVQLYHWDGVQWLPEGPLLRPTTTYHSLEVELQGNRLLMSVSLGVHRMETSVHEYRNNAWEQLGATFTRPQGESKYRGGMALDGDHLILSVSGTAIDPQARVVCYHWNGNSWEEASSLNVPGPEWTYAQDVALDGDRLAIIAYDFSYNGRTKAWLYQRIDGEWQAMMSAPEGEHIYRASGDKYTDVVLHNNHLLLGAYHAVAYPIENSPRYRAGMVDHYEWNGQQWEHKKTFHGIDNYALWGRTIGINDDYLVFGAVNEQYYQGSLPRGAIYTQPFCKTQPSPDAWSTAYPNPTTGPCTLAFDAVYERIYLELYNSSGQLLRQERYSTVDQLEFNLSDYPAGLYLLKVKLDDEEATYQKVIKYQ